MLRNIQQLREIANTCLDGKPLDQKHARWLGSVLNKYLSQHVRSIDDAMGLRSDRGGVPWWMEEAMRKRDQALRMLAEQFAAHLGSSAQARYIYQLAIRYAASAWRFDRERATLPEGYAGSVHEYLWRAFTSGAPMPIGERRLRTLLAH